MIPSIGGSTDPFAPQDTGLCYAFRTYFVLVSPFSVFQNARTEISLEDTPPHGSWKAETPSKIKKNWAVYLLERMYLIFLETNESWTRITLTRKARFFLKCAYACIQRKKILVFFSQKIVSFVFNFPYLPSFVTHHICMENYLLSSFIPGVSGDTVSKTPRGYHRNEHRLSATTIRRPSHSTSFPCVAKRPRARCRRMSRIPPFHSATSSVFNDNACQNF